MNGFGEPGPGEITGYASTFSNVDLVGDAVAPTAFINLSDFARRGTILWAHDPARPVAAPLETRADSFGLWLRCRLHSTPDGQMAGAVVRERMAAGLPTGLSIGYDIVKWHREGKVRVLDAIFLHEVSIVSLPANPMAGVLSIKLGPPPATATATPGTRDPAAMREFLRLLEAEARAVGVAV